MTPESIILKIKISFSSIKSKASSDYILGNFEAVCDVNRPHQNPTVVAAGYATAAAN